MPRIDQDLILKAILTHDCSKLNRREMRHVVLSDSHGGLEITDGAVAESLKTGLDFPRFSYPRHFDLRCRWCGRPFAPDKNGVCQHCAGPPKRGCWWYDGCTRSAPPSHDAFPVLTLKADAETANVI